MNREMNIDDHIKDNLMPRPGARISSMNREINIEDNLIMSPQGA